MTNRIEQAISWAAAESERLKQVHPPGSNPSTDTRRGELFAAVEFLRLQAGPRSDLYALAARAAGEMHMNSAHNVVAASLRGWVDLVQKGLLDSPAEAQARTLAANDLMEQMEILLDTSGVHPAAPVVLAGAALEELLRSMVDSAGIEIDGKPGLNTYANALRTAAVLSAQDVKNITSWAGLRNAAAHGNFDQIELPNARPMAQSVNIFMQKYASS